MAEGRERRDEGDVQGGVDRTFLGEVNRCGVVGSGRCVVGKCSNPHFAGILVVPLGACSLLCPFYSLQRRTAEAAILTFSMCRIG
jgi:hypothetical protein